MQQYLSINSYISSLYRYIRMSRLMGDVLLSIQDRLQFMYFEIINYFL